MTAQASAAVALLIDADAECARASRASETARLAREDAIRAAVSAGMSTREVAQYVSITAQRVQQIASR